MLEHANDTRDLCGLLKPFQMARNFLHQLLDCGTGIS
jgi:hypothetical protein